MAHGSYRGSRVHRLRMNGTQKFLVPSEFLDEAIRVFTKLETNREQGKEIIEAKIAGKSNKEKGG